MCLLFSLGCGLCREIRLPLSYEPANIAINIALSAVSSSRSPDSGDRSPLFSLLILTKLAFFSVRSYKPWIRFNYPRLEPRTYTFPWRRLQSATSIVFDAQSHYKWPREIHLQRGPPPEYPQRHIDFRGEFHRSGHPLYWSTWEADWTISWNSPSWMTPVRRPSGACCLLRWISPLLPTPVRSASEADWADSWNSPFEPTPVRMPSEAHCLLRWISPLRLTPARSTPNAGWAISWNWPRQILP